MPELNSAQFGPWKMSPGMKRAYDHMKQNHVGIENAGTTNDITARLSNYGSRAMMDRHWEYLHRLKDNGLIKIDHIVHPNDPWQSVPEEHAWVTND